MNGTLGNSGYFQPVQSPSTWNYDIDPMTGSARAYYPGEVLANVSGYVGGLASVTALEAASVPAYVNSVMCNGYYTIGDGGAGTYTRSGSNGPGPGLVQSADGSWWLLTGDSFNLRQFGAKGDGVTDDTSAIQNAIDFIVAKLPSTLHAPTGTYLTSSQLTGLATDGFRMQGDGIFHTIFKCTHSNEAFKIDAFASGSPTDPFISVSLNDFTIEGNSTTTFIMWAQGIERAEWKLAFKEANTATGIACSLYGCNSNVMRLMCSNDAMPMTNIPSEGLRLSAGSRAGSSVGNSSNNTFIDAQFDTLPICGRLAGADQNVFVGGAFQAASTYGMIVATGSRYNSFLGTGFENPAATADISDDGISTQYMNIYASNEVMFQLPSRACRLMGGFFRNININAGAQKIQVKAVTVNHWTGGTGVTDAGTASEISNVYDETTATFVNPNKPRTNITIGASPFSWTNDTDQFVSVIIPDGTVTQILSYRGTDFWQVPHTSPTSTLVAPGDRLVISYTGAPTTISFVPYTGLPG